MGAGGLFALRLRRRAREGGLGRMGGLFALRLDAEPVKGGLGVRAGWGVKGGLGRS